MVATSYRDVPYRMWRKEPYYTYRPHVLVIQPRAAKLLKMAEQAIKKGWYVEMSVRIVNEVGKPDVPYDVIDLAIHDGSPVDARLRATRKGGT